MGAFEDGIGAVDGQGELDVIIGLASRAGDMGVGEDVDAFVLEEQVQRLRGRRGLRDGESLR